MSAAHKIQFAIVDGGDDVMTVMRLIKTVQSGTSTDAKNKVKRKFFCELALVCVLIFCVICTKTEAAEVPRAQLDESERHLTNAHLYFMNQDYWNAGDQLERALKANTYLVDFYLMNGLNLQRTGDLEEARKSLASYLEVRPMDPTAPRIMNEIIEQTQLLRRVLANGPLSAKWRLAEMDLLKEWRSGAIRPFSIKGMGKVEALGDVIAISDTFGNQVCIVSIPGKATNLNATANGNTNISALSGIDSTLSDLTGSRYVKKVSIARPVATLPLGNGVFYVFNASGDVHVLTNGSGQFPLTANTAGTPLSSDLVGHLDNTITNTVSDAEWVSATEFVVSDPVARNIAFYDRRTFIPTATWTPPESELDLLFEPVALERYANWLAIADRSNNRVYILNLTTTTGAPEFFSIDIPLVRDLLWSPLGELLALSERGDVFQLEVDFNAKNISVVTNKPLWTELENAWAMFHSNDGGLYCMDVAGTKLWKAVMLPSQIANFGFLSLYHPRLVLEPNRESFLIDAAISSPFLTYFQNAQQAIHCIWNERSLNATTLWKETPVLDAVLLHRPLAVEDFVPAELRTLAVNNGQDVRVILPPLWTSHRGTLTNIIVDSSVDFTFDDLLNLTCFCLMNGLELDIWARSVPSLALSRASALTSGQTLYALGSPLALSVPKTRMQIQIPLPEELSSSGYPSRSMLSMYLDIGLVQTRSWIPLWPDMFQ